jgi:hypothetical protein
MFTDQTGTDILKPVGTGHALGDNFHRVRLSCQIWYYYRKSYKTSLINFKNYFFVQQADNTVT